MSYAVAVAMEKKIPDGSVAEVMRELARARGLKIKDLMRRTGLSRPTVSRHFNGWLFPSVDDREKYAKAFNVTLEWFESLWQERRRLREDETVLPPPPWPVPVPRPTGDRTHSTPASDAIRLAETVDDETWAGMLAARKAAKKKQKGPNAQ